MLTRSRNPLRVHSNDCNDSTVTTGFVVPISLKRSGKSLEYGSRFVNDTLFKNAKIVNHEFKESREPEKKNMRGH